MNMLEPSGTIINSSGEKTIHLHPNWSVYYTDDKELAEAADLVVEGIVKEDLAVILKSRAKIKNSLLYPKRVGLTEA